MTATLAIRRGAIYLSADTYDEHFNGLSSVIVLIRNAALNILPVQHMASGGYLIKIRNAKGDRVIAAPDVFQEHGLMDWEISDLPAHWSEEMSALICQINKV